MVKKKIFRRGLIFVLSPVADFWQDIELGTRTALCAVLLASSQDFIGYLPEFQREVGVDTSILF